MGFAFDAWRPADDSVSGSANLQARSHDDLFPVLQDVFLMIRRKKLTIFTDAKDDTTVLELKKMIEGIMKVPPANQQLFNKDNLLMSDNKTLQDYGLTSSTAKAQCPALVGLALRQPDGQFETLEMTPFSLPPDLPDVMKSQENNGQEQSP
ncbi:Transcription elongation factor B polypeptide 2 [Temnothorax longispinosus]|uniref:Elongin-B n=1 Tax=Temnothorax longispinosus TaxID=300112 RepID=A0A4S2L2C2_9HYME|nr:Transcription elongation factor B polypeptide 2 [Temnothorax longispinosus]